ncbi:hypothetical protein [Embleya sp. NBC_00896]|uniref:hypothetical protein n=1 Tax=Embleya sp. NBC_00896 TaxID=2975961 RepID=UPI00386863BD|nr:hypothetical protein OG928_15350 [Embleya sp. NBC_00896]
MHADGEHGERRSFRNRFLAVGGLLTTVQAAVVLGAAAVSAEPSPGATPTGTPAATPSGGKPECDLLTGPAKDICNNGGPSAPGTGTLGTVTDPLGSIAKGCAEAATWIIDKLAGAVNDTTQVDFTNPGFLRQYAVVFAASTFLTLILWILAVAKRAVRGVPIGTAISEAVGYLWLAVIASAFTPLMLYLAVSMTDAITAAIATGTQQDTNKFLGGFSKALDPASGLGGGPVMLIFVSLLSMAAAAVLWVELLVRAAMLYVGAILGTAVYSGLVDKAMWHHVRRWAGIMIAVLLAKPVVVIVLGLATAVTSTGGQKDAFSSVLSGLAILFLSIFASVLIYRFVPNFGDDMASLHSSRKAMQSAGPASMVNGPATYVKQGIQAHASRGSSGSGSAPATANAVSSGIAAHGTRGGGSGGAPAPAPPPPANPAATPHARNGNE